MSLLWRNKQLRIGLAPDRVYISGARSVDLAAADGSWQAPLAALPGALAGSSLTVLPSDTTTRSGPSTMRSFFLRHKSDTVDLLECGFAGVYQLHRRVAQRDGAGGSCGFLELPCARAGNDELAQLVVQHQ